MQAAQLQAALQGHDRIRRSTDLPLFYGKKEKDTITPHILLDRMEAAAPIAGWDTDARKCAEFFLTLRDRALIWWSSLDEYDVNKQDWAIVKREFLAAYEPRFTARTTCTNFQDLVQRQGENIHDYFLRVTESFKRMCDAKPANIGDIRADEPDEMANTAAARLQLRNVKKEGLMDMQRFFLHQLFIAGLKDEIRSKVMEAGKDNIQESLAHARELEVILNDKKKSNVVASIPECEGLCDEELEAVNAIRFQRGQQPFRRQGFQPNQAYRSNPSQPTSTPSKIVCRYCKIPGHLQKDCRKRKAAKAPCVDENGKPYAKQINAVETAQQTSSSSSQATNSQSTSQGGLSSIGMAALNW